MLKRFVCALLVFVMALELAACGAGTTGEASAAAKVIGTTGSLIPVEELEPHSSSKELGWQLDMPEKGEEIAVITMKTGEVIKIRFFPEEAPKAVYNFKLHALQGYYDGLTFHRVMENFMIQGGSPDGTGADGESVWQEDFEDEFADNLLNLDGALSMANRGENTNGSQFFINCTNTPTDASIWDQYQQGFEIYKQDPDTFTKVYAEKWLDMDKVKKQGKYKELYDTHGGNYFLDGAYSTNQTGHTVFGQVFEGMDSVYALSQVETDSQTNKPVEDMVIEKIEIVEYQ